MVPAHMYFLAKQEQTAHFLVQLADLHAAAAVEFVVVVAAQKFAEDAFAAATVSAVM